MIPADEHVLRAIVRLKGMAEFDVLMKYFNDSYKEQLVMNCTIKDDVLLRWNQGKSQVLGDILTVFDNARNMMDKIKR